MEVRIPNSEVEAFGRILKTGQYRQFERGYKWANHLALQAVFSADTSSKFAGRLALLFGRGKADLSELGLSSSAQTEWHSAVHGGSWDARKILTFLTGGMFAFANFDWIPAAIDRGFGGAISSEFKALARSDVALDDRIKLFRNSLREIQGKARTSKRSPQQPLLRKPSLAFIGAILVGLDPTAYTAYNKRAIEHGLTKYARVDSLSKGSAGEKYSEACEFIKAVSDRLVADGVPIADLIDAQSFVWISAGNHWDQYRLGPDEEDLVKFIEQPGKESDAKTRKAIETYAVMVTTKYLRNEGWVVEAKGAPYDLYCTKPTGVALYVEVKGSRGHAESVILTSNEVDHARSHHPNTALAVVHGIEVGPKPTLACGGGHLEWHGRWRPDEVDLYARAYAYQRPAKGRKLVHDL